MQYNFKIIHFKKWLTNRSRSAENFFKKSVKFPPKILSVIIEGLINLPFSHHGQENDNAVKQRGDAMEDSEIVRLFSERNETALSCVSEKYGIYCASIARNILKNHEEAEECVNDAYLKAWNSIPPNVPNSLGAYLGRITKNIALNRISFFNREKRGGGDYVSFDELDEFVSGKNSVESDAEHRELLSEINAFLKKQPVKSRRLFVGRYWGMCGLAELGERFGLSESGVSLSLSRTRKKLKEYLLKRGFEI